jgi:hypothetical protein
LQQSGGWRVPTDSYCNNGGPDANAETPTGVPVPLPSGICDRFIQASHGHKVMRVVSGPDFLRVGTEVQRPAEFKLGRLQIKVVGPEYPYHGGAQHVVAQSGAAGWIRATGAIDTSSAAFAESVAISREMESILFLGMADRLRESDVLFRTEFHEFGEGIAANQSTHNRAQPLGRAVQINILADESRVCS